MVTSIDWETFERDGFLRLGHVSAAGQLSALQTRVNEIMLGEVRYPGMYFQLDTETGEYADVPAGGEWAGPTLGYRKIEMLERDEHFLRYIQNPLFHEITVRVYGPDVSVYRAMFMNKPARRGTVLPYHQDGGSQWGLDRNPLVTIWTALDDAVAENGCMQVMPGSHRHGLFSERGHTITPEQEATYARDADSLFLPATAGEAILLHNWLLHRSGVNSTDAPRRAFSVCYMDAATRSVADPGHGFPKVFGDGALQPGYARAEDQ